MLAVAVGVIVGVAAALLIGAIELTVEGVSWLSDRFGSARAVSLIVLPLGFVLAAEIARRFAPEVAGDGVPEATAALAIRSGYLSTRSIPLKMLVTALTLGANGSAGREGPLVQVGAAIGSSVSRHTGLGEDKVRSLVAAGAGAAIGASFNAPIAGMLFAMEVMLGNFAVRHLNAVVVASVSAAVTTRSIVGEERILRARPHSLGDPRELFLYALLALAVVAAGWLLLKLLDAVHRRRFGSKPWARPLVLGLGVAAIGFFEPEILGTGQDLTAELINVGSISDVAWGSLVAIAFWKIVATSLTIQSGTSGGVFMPSLLIGSSLGVVVATLFQEPWGISVLDPGAFAVVGMAAAFAAIARAPLTAILIVFEITGDYGLVLPLMLAASLATFLGDRVHPDSVYTLALTHRGIRLTRRSEVDVLDTVMVGDVIQSDSATLDSAMTTGDAQGTLDRLHQHGLPVVDEGALVGVLTVSDIMRTGGPSDQTRVADAMTPRPITATPSTPVSMVLERMASLGIGRVPIVANDDSSSLVGLFRREDAVRAYHVALGQEVEHEIGRTRLRTRVDPGTEFWEVPVPAGSFVDGRMLSEAPIPEACIVVAVRRGREVIVPHGNTVVRSGDTLAVFGRPEAADRLAERLGSADDLRTVTDGDATTARFFDVEIPGSSMADRRALRELAIPDGCTVVSIRRGHDVIIPRGNTELLAGDVLTVFAQPDARGQLVERLRTGLEGAQ